MSSILDLSGFPIVRLNVDDRTSGNTQDWINEMDALLAREEPFAIVSCSRMEQDNPQDEQQRGNWYRTNNERLATWCKVMVYIEPDDLQREKLKRQLEGLRKVFLFRFDLVASEEEALSLAQDFLQP
jgi:hypothetical protein